MLIRTETPIPSSEITDERLYWNRREWLRKAGLLAGAAATGLLNMGCRAEGQQVRRKTNPGPYDTDEPWTSYEAITTYNNFYEFGTGKRDPSRNAHRLRTRPWTLQIDGLCHRPGTYQLEDFIKPYKLEERVYRLRCVEGWSMVIPWLGFPLADVIRRAEPMASAKFVEFTTLYDPEQMPGQKVPILDWPYVEGLRLDEALHPLTILAVGLYGKMLPNQNGAPIRLVVPWKYGFKSIKSIVRIRFVEKQPITTWMKAAPHEYGFYSNVNPNVDHPRWSQKTERRIGEFRKRKTLMFNGYADQVAHLYAGMDLKKYF